MSSQQKLYLTSLSHYTFLLPPAAYVQTSYQSLSSCFFRVYWLIWVNCINYIQIGITRAFFCFFFSVMFHLWFPFLTFARLLTSFLHLLILLLVFFSTMYLSFCSQIFLLHQLVQCSLYQQPLTNGLGLSGVLLQSFRLLHVPFQY